MTSESRLVPNGPQSKHVVVQESDQRGTEEDAASSECPVEDCPKSNKTAIQEEVEEDLQHDVANEAVEAEGDEEQDVASEESQVSKMVQNRSK